MFEINQNYQKINSDNQAAGKGCLMDILLISEYILMASLAIFAIASVRIATRKTTGMGLVGVSGLSIAVATHFNIDSRTFMALHFVKILHYALVILGPVGTIAFARVLRG